MRTQNYSSFVAFCQLLMLRGGSIEVFSVLGKRFTARVTKVVWFRFELGELLLDVGY